MKRFKLRQSVILALILAGLFCWVSNGHAQGTGAAATPGGFTFNPSACSANTTLPPANTVCGLAGAATMQTFGCNNRFLQAALVPPSMQNLTNDLNSCVSGLLSGLGPAAIFGTFDPMSLLASAACTSISNEFQKMITPLEEFQNSLSWPGGGFTLPGGGEIPLPSPSLNMNGGSLGGQTQQIF